MSPPPVSAASSSSPSSSVVWRDFATGPALRLCVLAYRHGTRNPHKTTTITTSTTPLGSLFFLFLFRCPLRFLQFSQLHLREDLVKLGVVARAFHPRQKPRLSLGRCHQLRLELPILVLRQLRLRDDTRQPRRLGLSLRLGLKRRSPRDCLGIVK